jgi:hypothetical protein
LRAAESFPVKLDVKPLGGEEALLMGDEIVETHALGRDFDMLEVRSHDDVLRDSNSLADIVPYLFVGKLTQNSSVAKMHHRMEAGFR